MVAAKSERWYVCPRSDAFLSSYGLWHAIKTVVILLYKWNGYCFQLLWIGPLVTIPYVALQLRRSPDVLKSRTRSGEGSASRMCADPGCHDPMIWPAELSEWTCVCRTVWFVELAYRACVSHVRNPYVNSSAVNQREYWTFDVIKSIAIECVRAQPGGVCIKLVQFSVPWWIHGTVKPSCNDGPTQDADCVTIVSVTQVPILTQTRFYQPVNELNLTMKVAVNRPRKQYRPQASWFASFVPIWWF